MCVMGSTAELSLECKVESYSMLLKYSFGDHHDHDQSYDKLQDFVSRLEEEHLKIDVFKRELPLCMQLLTNAVETSRRQLQACKTMEAAAAAAAPTEPILEEFMPLKNSTPADDEKTPTISSDKANWMTSVQLWSQAGDVISKQQSESTDDHSKLQDCNNNKDNNLETCSQRINNSGAFVPFNKDRSSGPAAKMELLEKGEKKNCSDNNSNIDGGVVMAAEQRSENGAAEAGSAPTTTQTHRKARRCWSPDLHRRFVNALQMLGGSQVATPKQIRELMKVDGLTNDEVKSHLQKYRLHTRRPGPTQQASGPPAAQLVVLGLGGLWVPPEYAAAAAAPPALYGPAATSHPASHFYTPPEFYARTAPAPHLQHHHHHQVQLYKGAPPQATQSSPESEVRDTAERSESFEEEKSGSTSWRIEGGENARGSCGRRSEENEESNNRSEITLKF
ncbi:myb family transcription factor EFM-like isoform X1 [Cucumis melo]|uniref:Myb family transcription factor EFM-like isoform X1 n=2 Tax=Cucumis melo TaxID=3656 RepID=A0A1S3CJ16_CUCME|nr:myb family transcription factor EFM-like isoform X1 [Cucumis melo]